MSRSAALLPLWTVIPFVALLLCIAILPLAAGHWWEHNDEQGDHRRRCWAAIVAAYVAVGLDGDRPGTRCCTC